MKPPIALRLAQLFTGVMFAVFFIILPLTAIWWRGRDRNPLKKIGVGYLWTFPGASSTYPALDLWIDRAGKRTKCPVTLGGIADAELDFEDMDGDRVPDIVFGTGEERAIISVDPKNESEPFRLLSDTRKSP